MRLLPTAVSFLFVSAVLTAACGGPPAAPRPDAAADDAFWPDPAARSLQRYMVLTSDPAAMQTADAFAKVDACVNGEGARCQAVRRQVRMVPNGYSVDWEVDFADLPHPKLDAVELAGLLKQLPAPARAQAEGAKLAVFVHGDARLLPQGEQIRLTGLVPLYIADRWGGVAILDLLTRRAYTPDAWHAGLSAPKLGEKQVRYLTKDEAGGKKWLLTRGNPKFGLPDLEMRGIESADLTAARARFMAAQAKLHAGGPSALPAAPCTGPKGTYDADCRAVK